LLKRRERHYGEVMTRAPPRINVRDMQIHDRINTVVLQEFRLHQPDSAGEVARIVAAFAGGIERAVPLLTSIDDNHDVAIVRGLHAGEQSEADPSEHDALDPFVASWKPIRQYGPRITERSESPPTYYRLAVTESGISNTPEPTEPRAAGATDASTSRRVGLLWIGLPVGTYAGLLTLLGTDDETDGRSEPRGWLPLSRSLGVRIYESQA
jgi:hypothetical protein